MLDDAMKELVVFDLDGTLAPSKSSIDAEPRKQARCRSR
jgi:hydroxymethylpyrimidine pyrophosphatase-like HAD family hydrolase